MSREKRGKENTRDSAKVIYVARKTINQQKTEHTAFIPGHIIHCQVIGATAVDSKGHKKRNCT